MHPPFCRRAIFAVFAVVIEVLEMRMALEFVFVIFKKTQKNVCVLFTHFTAE